MKKEDLQKLIEDDDLGLLKVKPKASKGATADERLISKFQEINSFIAEYGREPTDNLSDMTEFQLYATLEGIRESEEKLESIHPSLKAFALIVFDEYNATVIGVEYIGEDNVGSLPSVVYLITAPEVEQSIETSCVVV